MTKKQHFKLECICSKQLIFFCLVFCLFVAVSFVGVYHLDLFSLKKLINGNPIFIIWFDYSYHLEIKWSTIQPALSYIRNRP